MNARTLTVTAVLALAMLASAGCSSDSSTAQGTPPSVETTAPTTNVLPTSPADAATPEDLGTYPIEIQVYVSMAHDLVETGTLSRDKVTADAVAEDVAREYGITLTDAEAQAVVREILR